MGQILGIRRRSFAPQCLDPNITGECVPGNPSRWLSMGDCTGAFSTVEPSGGDGAANLGNSYPAGLKFDASQDDATYAYDKLQVASLQALACIKI